MYAAVVSQLYRNLPHFFFLRECFVKDMQVNWRNHSRVGFSAVSFTNKFILFGYCLIKHFEHKVLSFYYLCSQLYANCFVLTVAMVTAVQFAPIFPPKYLEKYGRSKYACAFFLILFLVVNICLKILQFSRQKTWKNYGRPKYACTVFFLIYILNSL